MRGEHCKSSRNRPARVGSSPHARGTRAPGGFGLDQSRFIPACAGNTVSSWIIPRRWPVHPRMRGEHSRVERVTITKIGSSPHARGTRRSIFKRHSISRFIPACAGNTVNACMTLEPGSVHPRMRGEHVAVQLNELLHVGSSPHARGTRAPEKAPHELLRFIPACAGNTWPTDRDHEG